MTTATASMENSLRHAIGAAMTAAIHQVTTADQAGNLKTQSVKSNLSKRFVAHVGHQLTKIAAATFNEGQLRSWYLDKSEITPSLRSGHGEFLWDVFIGAVDSKSVSKEPPICRGIWAVESELKNSFAKLQRDFSKLTVAKVDERLFVMPRLSERNRAAAIDAFARQCHMSGVHCWVALIPPLKRWTTEDQSAPAIELCLIGAHG